MDLIFIKFFKSQDLFGDLGQIYTQSQNLNLQGILGVGE